MQNTTIASKLSGGGGEIYFRSGQEFLAFTFK